LWNKENRGLILPIFAVIDSELRVHGIEGIRVVDASVMPAIVSGNLNAPTQMMAARAADFIPGKPPLLTELAKFQVPVMRHYWHLVGAMECWIMARFNEIPL
jgi:hypothetical protein